VDYPACPAFLDQESDVRCQTSEFWITEIIKPRSPNCISTASRSVRPLAREALPAMSLTPVAPFTEIATDLRRGSKDRKMDAFESIVAQRVI